MKITYIIYFLLLSFSLISCSANEIKNEENISAVISTVEDSVNSSVKSTETILHDISTSVDSLIEPYKDNLSIYYYNLDSETEYTHNENTYYVTASLKKVPLAMQVLDKVQAGEISLDTEIQYEYSDYANGTGILQFEEIIGSRTIKELIMLSMTESDNIAFNMLNRLCGYTLTDYVNSILGEEGMFIDDNGFSRLTAKHNFKILHTLYKNPNNNEHYNLIIDYLKDTAFNDSINKYLPKGSVSHKIGSYFRSYHDEAIVFSKENYILVILTKDIGELTDDPEFLEDDEERYLVDWGKCAFEVMALISNTIYNIINY